MNLSCIKYSNSGWLRSRKGSSTPFRKVVYKSRDFISVFISQLLTSLINEARETFRDEREKWMAEGERMAEKKDGEKESRRYVGIW